MRKMIFTAALAAILAITLAACGGDDGDAGEQRLHPVLNDATYLEIREGREYVIFTYYQTRGDLSDRINAIHQGGYELQHTTRDTFGHPIFVFRKIADPKNHRPRPARHPRIRTANLPQTHEPGNNFLEPTAITGYHQRHKN